MYILLIQLRGHAVTYRSAVGHMVSRDANLQARVHQAWTLEHSEVQNFSALRFRSAALASVLMEVNAAKSVNLN